MEAEKAPFEDQTDGRKRDYLADTINGRSLSRVLLTHLQGPTTKTLCWAKERQPSLRIDSIARVWKGNCSVKLLCKIFSRHRCRYRSIDSFDILHGFWKVA
jgi:hypothetical protein